MPNAQSLPEAYNNFIVEPLEEEDEFRDFYVERLTPIEEIKERTEISKKMRNICFWDLKDVGKAQN